MNANKKNDIQKKMEERKKDKREIEKKKKQERLRQDEDECDCTDNHRLPFPASLAFSNPLCMSLATMNSALASISRWTP